MRFTSAGNCNPKPYTTNGLETCKHGSNTRTLLVCKREAFRAHPVCRTLLAREVSTVKYLPGWLAGPPRACFSQTFGIITLRGTLAALIMLSASAVADSHPWRRRMRYIQGVVVFATAIAGTHAHTHILPKLQHHATGSDVWNIST